MLEFLADGYLRMLILMSLFGLTAMFLLGCLLLLIHRRRSGRRDMLLRAIPLPPVTSRALLRLIEPLADMLYALVPFLMGMSFLGVSVYFIFLSNA